MTAGIQSPVKNRSLQAVTAECMNSSTNTTRMMALLVIVLRRLKHTILDLFPLSAMLCCLQAHMIRPARLDL